MFGSNNGSSAFGQQPAFGGFGASSQPSPFGSTLNQSQQSSLDSNLFGSSSTPSFGATNTSTFGSGGTFGASATPAFGSSNNTPAFGTSNTTPAFGTSNTTPAFGTSNTTPAFGTSNTTPAFGTSNTTPPFGTSNTTPAFGTPNTSAFGSSNTSAFGSSNTSVFGSNTSPFGSSNNPAFGSSNTPAFGQTPTPSFNATSTPFGTPAVGSSSTQSFNFGSAGTSGQASPFAPTSSFGAQNSPIGSQNTALAFGQTSVGSQNGGSRIAPYTATPEAVDAGAPNSIAKLVSLSAMPVFKEKCHEELRWEDYQRGDKGGPNPAGQPTSGFGFGALPAQSSPPSTFGQQSSNPFSTPAASTPFSTPASSNLFSTPASSSPFSTPAASNPFSIPVASNPFSTPAASNPFSTPASSNPFSTPAAKPSPFSSTGFGTTSSAVPSGLGTSTTASPFGTSSTTTPSLFTPQPPSAFGSNTPSSVFGTSTSSTFGSSPSMFNSTSAQGATPAFGSTLNFTNNTPPQQFQSTIPSVGQAGGAFGQNSSPFGQASASFGQSNLSNAHTFGSSQPLTSNPVSFAQSLPTPFPSAQSTQSVSFSFPINKTQPTGAVGIGSNMLGQNIGILPVTQSSTVAQSVQNPFGLLPPVPQISTGHTGVSSSIQYGISSMRAVDKPEPTRISSPLTSRHLSQRRIKLPARKYHPKSDGLKVPFFSEDETVSSTPKADAVFVPRENPRHLIIQSKANTDKSSSMNGMHYTRHENGKISHGESDHMSNGSKAANKESKMSHGESEHLPNGSKADIAKEQNHSTKAGQNNYSNGTHTDHQSHKGDSYISLTSHRAGEAAIVYEHGADIEALMPKLRHPDYYTEPRVQQLAAKERAEPGFCRYVNDFVVGRTGYGSIKFLGATDVRRLDLESLIQFNNREVIVYLDDSKKPPVGQGLNKSAEVTLLNIKCFEKKSGLQYTEGPKIDKYKEMLKRKAESQGAEFLSYDPVKGEWKFRVSHFSKYELGDEDHKEEEEEDSLLPCAHRTI